MAPRVRNNHRNWNLSAFPTRARYGCPFPPVKSAKTSAYTIHISNSAPSTKSMIADGVAFPVSDVGVERWLTCEAVISYEVGGVVEERSSAGSADAVATSKAIMACRVCQSLRNEDRQPICSYQQEPQSEIFVHHGFERFWKVPAVRLRFWRKCASRRSRGSVHRS